MKDYDDELKDLFQKKNLEDAFTPDEQNWQKMAAVLKNEQKSKRKLLFFFGSLLLLMGIVGSIYFIRPETSTGALALTSKKVTEKEKTGEAMATTRKSTGKAPIDARINQEQEGMQHTHTPDLKTPVAGNSKMAGNEGLENKKENKEAKMIQEKKSPVQKELPGSQKVNPEKNPAIPVSANKGATGLNNDNNPSSFNESDLVKTGSEAAPAELPEEITQPEAKINTGNHLSRYMPEEKQAGHTPEPAAGKPSDVLSADILTMTYAVLPVQKPDSLLRGAVFKEVAKIPYERTLSRSISMEVGTNYLLGWKSGGGREAAGFNPLVGLTYSHELTRKVALSLGVQYSTINHLWNTSHTSTTTRLKFGEEVDATVVSALNMHYLYVPIKINYRLNRNNSLSLGYTIAYLLDVESKIETYSTRLNYTSLPVVSKSMGYTSGFNPCDGQVAISYRRRLYNQLYVNGEFYYGLLDIKKNDVYKLNKFERSAGFKLGLSINLWKNN